MHYDCTIRKYYGLQFVREYYVLQFVTALSGSKYYVLQWNSSVYSLFIMGFLLILVNI